jgi:hypothetical protein
MTSDTEIPIFGKDTMVLDEPREDKELLMFDEQIVRVINNKRFLR